VLHAEGPLPLPRAVDYLLQACKGLAMAHAAGIVHGQLDTSRLLLARRGAFETLKVIDFPTLGAAPAELLGEGSPPRSQRGDPAPEVLRRAAPIDGRADVWSLGAVLFELVSGRPALTSTAGSAELGQDVALSPALRRIIARCLQPDPTQRFPDVDELAAELLPLTTLNEVFRGSLTGSFSRQMMMAAAAQAHAEATAARSAPPRAHRWRTHLERLRSHLPELGWQARWRVFEQTWQRVAPEELTLQRALTVAGGALLIGLACARLGHVRLVPPPGAPAPERSITTAALEPDPAPAAGLAPAVAPVERPPLGSAASVAVEAPGGGPALIRPPRPASTAAKHRRHQKRRSARRAPIAHQ
jgi:hypothetical protein